ncbi:MAG: cation diffusion facilitator family transporter [Oscillospiraceae bacterium]|nr:cation diffusion facilitator family transporter [Oscillospiraceae bacterium]
MNEANQKLVTRVALQTLVVNFILSAFKLFAGIFGQSAAMISDAVHSVSDTATTIVVIAGVKMAGRKSDKEHPYGHDRMECVAAIIIAAVLVVVGAMIGWEGVKRMLSPEELPIPGVVALIAAAASIAVKEGMYWYARLTAEKAGSGALKADAWHHRSDGLSSVGSFAGILGARLGLPILDPAVCLIICAFVVKAGVDVFLDAVSKMTDKSCDDKTADAIRAAVLENPAVLGIDTMRTRLFGEMIYMDVEISLDGSVTLSEAHETAEEVHREIEARFPRVKHCMIHVNPSDTSP